MHSWFAEPLALHLFWLLPLVGLLALLAARRRRRAWAQLGRLALADAGRHTVLFGSAGAACWGLGLSLLVLAIAGPRWGREGETNLVPGRDLVAVLDMSRSMLAGDVFPSRLEQAQQALMDLSRAVERRGGYRLALVVFAAQARVACPLTHDYEHFRTAVAAQDGARPHPDIRPRDEAAPSGTRLGAALIRAVELHDSRFKGFQDIVLVSDGDDPAGDEEWRGGAAAARQRGIPVFVLGIGDPEKPAAIPGKENLPLRYNNRVVESQLEEEALREIARLSRGAYIPARTQSVPMEELFRTIIEPRPVFETAGLSVAVAKPRYAWFMSAALAALALGMLSPWLRLSGSASSRQELQTAPPVRARSAMLAFLPMLAGLLSAAPPAAWQKLLRQGNAAYLSEDYTAATRFYEQAEILTRDPGLVAFNKAAALYHWGLAERNDARRQELFRESERCWQACLEDAPPRRRARAFFHLGNARLQLAQDRHAGILEQAIEAYEEYLHDPAAAPELAADVRHNLELAKTLWLKARARQDRVHAEESSTAQPDQGRPPSDPSEAMTKDGLLPPRDARPQRGQGRPNGSGMTHSTSQAPPPGRGNLPPLLDQDAPMRLTQEEAAAYLRQAAVRIERERTDHHGGAATAVSPKVKDW